MQNNLYTVGELAKMAGVSLRTIHFYDMKGLLCPVAYSESGYRLYAAQLFLCRFNGCLDSFGNQLVRTG